MRHITLQALTWGTVTAAVSSALWLAASEPSSWPDARRLKPPAPTLQPQPERRATGTSRSGTEASPGEPQRSEPLSR